MRRRFTFALGAAASPKRASNVVPSEGQSSNNQELIVVRRPTFRSTVCAMIFIVTCGTLFPAAKYIYRRYYYFLGCPEKAIFIRRPRFFAEKRTTRNGVSNDGDTVTPSLLYLTAKFAAPGNVVIPKEVSNHVQSIMSKGLFRPEEVRSYSTFPQFIRDDPVWKRHLQFYFNDPTDASRRGGGYWFWKPALIYHHLLHEIDEGDYLIYSDSDRVDFMSWLAYLLETMQERGADLALEQMSFEEGMWTKGDVYSYFNVSQSQLPYSDESFQYSGNFIVVRKNKAIIQFFKDWREAATKYYLLSDDPSYAPNPQGFIENRHDQSLMSMLVKYHPRYRERGKEVMVWECLSDWTTYTFRMED
mmetsp:Transcript_8231/g.10132  ORF Transcript_8231/g.10132 Transcript_8231/m.10132 type:complete len:359 (-) Transcript_8231:220-1296(-)